MKIEQNITFHLLRRGGVVIILFCFVLSSCNVYKYLDEDEILLVSQKMEIVDDQELDNSIDAKAGLNSFLKPELNSKLIIARNRLAKYLKAREKNPDAKRIKKMEYPVLVDSARHQLTSEKMENYLRQSGYFDAEVSYKLSYGKKKGRVKYLLDPGKRLYVDSIAIWSNDLAIQKILDKNTKDQILKKDAALSVNNYENERTRIVALLRDNGYAAFYPNYIDIIKSDSLGRGEIEVLQIFDSLDHKTYDVNSMQVYLQDRNDNPLTKSDTINNIIYHYNGDKPYINLDLLDRKLLFNPGDLYRKNDIDRSRVLFR